MSNSESSNDRDHLDDVPDGCGCVEVWTVLSERRAADRGADESGQVRCDQGSSA